MKATPLTLRKKLALELWRQHENIVRKEHPLKQLFWECTSRCDLKCRHCGSDCKMQPESKDMPKEDFLRVLDSIAVPSTRKASHGDWSPTPCILPHSVG